MKISEGRNNIKNALLIDAVGQGFVSSLKNKPRGIWGGSAWRRRMRTTLEWKYLCRAPVCNRGAR